MKKPCALLFLFLAVSSFTAVPIQPEVRGLIDGFFNSILNIFNTITNGTLSIFNTFVQNISTLLSDALAGINALANSTIQAMSNTTMSAIAIFKQILALPANIGKNMQNALNINPNTAINIIIGDFQQLIDATNTTFQMASEVEEEIASQLADNITALIKLKEAIIANVTAAVKYGTSGFFNMLFPKPLIQTLGDVTLQAIQAAIKNAASLINSLSAIFANAITSNPFISFIRDAMVAPTQQALNGALNQIIQLIDSTAGSIVQQFFVTVNAAINFTQNIVPSIQNSTTIMIGNLQVKITGLLKNATQLSDSFKANITNQIQSFIANLTTLGNDIAMNFTMAFKNLTEELQKDINEAVHNIHELGFNLTQKVLGVLNTTTNRTCTKAKCAINALKGIKPSVQQGITGLINCVLAAVNTIANSTESIVVGVNSTLSCLAANFTSCINLSTESAVKACLAVSITFNKKKHLSLNNILNIFRPILLHLFQKWLI